MLMLFSMFIFILFTIFFYPIYYSRILYTKYITFTDPYNYSCLNIDDYNNIPDCWFLNIVFYLISIQTISLCLSYIFNKSKTFFIFPLLFIITNVTLMVIYLFNMSYFDNTMIDISDTKKFQFTYKKVIADYLCMNVINHFLIVINLVYLNINPIIEF